MADNESGGESEGEGSLPAGGRGRGGAPPRGGKGPAGGGLGGAKGGSRRNDESESEDGELTDAGAQWSMMMKMQRRMMKEFMAPVAEVMKEQMKGKRRRDDDEDGLKSLPILVDIENHHLKDDAHKVLDMTARALRPYNGGDLAAYWAKRPRKAEPVIEDLRMAHLTKEPVNPSTIVKLHDRGVETTAKQWLCSNYSVRANDRKMRATDSGTAGAFYFDYADPAGVWEAVDAIHNYTMCLRMVREDDWSGQLMLKTLHECRMFAHPKFGSKEQKELIMTFFDKVLRQSRGLGMILTCSDLWSQVLKRNAMYGSGGKPPMDEREMMDVAKAVLLKGGQLTPLDLLVFLLIESLTIT